VLSEVLPELLLEKKLATTLLTLWGSIDMKCPRCTKSMKGHAIWSLGSVSLGSVDLESELDVLIANQKWKQAREDFAVANLPEDIIAWQAIRCRDGEVFLAKQILRFELWQDDTLERLVSLQPSVQQEIKDEAGQDWKEI
jgi:hypothetical protein